MLVGIVVGIMASLASGKMLQGMTVHWLKRLYPPPRQNADAAYLKRAETVIAQRYHRSLFLPMMPLVFSAFGIGAFFFSRGLATADWSFVLPIGFGLATVCSYPFFLHLPLIEYRKKVSSYVGRQVGRDANPEEAGKLLIAAASSSEPITRLAAIAGLRELGTNSGIAALKKLTEDKVHEVASQANDAMNDLMPALRGESVLSVRTMDTYVEEHRFLSKNIGRVKDEKAKRTFEKLHEITMQIDEIVYSQLKIRRSFPDVYCIACYARAESQRYEEWEWVRCKQCKEVHDLRAGVEKVYGQIGGNTLPPEGVLENGILHIGLWDEKTQKGRYGEIDVLEIIGGNGINYDWAIGAVNEKFHNQHQGPVNMLTVRLVNHPDLEPNTIQLLRTLDPGFMRG